MRILVSTSDKTGLVEFLRALPPAGLELVSTGGTGEYLRQNGFSVTEVSAVTGFPEVLDGRVKTLHPAVHMGLLADLANERHRAQLSEHRVTPFDLVVGNLYPFEQVARNAGASFDELIENIDIGGPSFLRAAAKNFRSVAVVASPADYGWVGERLRAGGLNEDERRRLAMKVFSLTSHYDALIVARLARGEDGLEYLNLPLKRRMKLRYGENAQQQADWYENPLAESSLGRGVIHQGKELSYNNLLDIEAAADLAARLERPACVAVKHNNPCGAACADSPAEAARRARRADPKSIFGGIVAFNRPVDLEACEVLQDIFLECVVAPEFTPESLKFLASKKNLRVLSLPSLTEVPAEAPGYRSVRGGLLAQDADSFDSAAWKFPAEPSPELLRDMRFGEKVAAALKSNAIAIVAGEQTVGLGMGQVNRVDAVGQALERMRAFARENPLDAARAVLVSDAFFPFADSIDAIAAAGIRWVVQPGGSVQDENVAAAARQHGINMVITGRRHFKH